MASSYKVVLPKAFPLCLTAKPNLVRRAIMLLTSQGRLRGSSFAVTVDNWDGTWNLWLSEASFSYLQKALDPEDILGKTKQT